MAVWPDSEEGRSLCLQGSRGMDARGQKALPLLDLPIGLIPSKVPMLQSGTECRLGQVCQNRGGEAGCSAWIQAWLDGISGSREGLPLTNRR